MTELYGRSLFEYLRNTVQDIADIRYSIFKEVLPEQLAHDIAYGSSILVRPEGETAFSHWWKNSKDADKEKIAYFARQHVAAGQKLLEELSGNIDESVASPEGPSADDVAKLHKVLIWIIDCDKVDADTLVNPDMYPAVKQIVEQGTVRTVNQLYTSVEFSRPPSTILSEWALEQLRSLLYAELRRYLANPPAAIARGFDPARPEASIAHMAARGQTPHFQAIDTSPVEEEEFDFLNSLDIDEDALDARRNGGGEAVVDDDADCEGCKI